MNTHNGFNVFKMKFISWDEGGKTATALVNKASTEYRYSGEWYDDYWFNRAINCDRGGDSDVWATDWVGYSEMKSVRNATREEAEKYMSRISVYNNKDFLDEWGYVYPYTMMEIGGEVILLFDGRMTIRRLCNMVRYKLRHFPFEIKMFFKYRIWR